MSTVHLPLTLVIQNNIRNILLIILIVQPCYRFRNVGIWADTILDFI